MTTEDSSQFSSESSPTTVGIVLTVFWAFESHALRAERATIGGWTVKEGCTASQDHMQPS